MRVRRVGILCLIFFIFFARPSLPQSTWQLSSRLQFGGEHDDNIFESSARPTSAYSGRMLFSSRADRDWRRTQLSFAYSGGVQTYVSHADENKLTNEASAEARWNLNSWCQLRGAFNGTLKVYFNGPNDFGTTQSALHIALQLPQQWSLRLSASSSRLDYAESDDFDYLGRALSATVRRPLTDWLIVEGGVELARLNFLRYAFDAAPDGIWFIAEDKQKDSQTVVHTRFIIGRRFLVSLSGDWQRNSSNSVGYDYERWRFSMIAAFRLSPRWLLRVAALRQNKDYLEDLMPVVPIELDTERNESNFIVADVSYDVTSQLGVLLRTAYYDNEAAIRGFFYQKTVLFTGVEYRF